LQRQLALALEKNENKFQIQGKANAVVEMLIKALKFEWKYLNPYLLSISTHKDQKKIKDRFWKTTQSKNRLMQFYRFLLNPISKKKCPNLLCV
jgi:rubrerythrin